MCSVVVTQVHEWELLAALHFCTYMYGGYYFVIIKCNTNLIFLICTYDRGMKQNKRKG